MAENPPLSALSAKEGLWDDDDLCPPALSPYALSILDYKPKKSNNKEKTTNNSTFKANHQFNQLNSGKLHNSTTSNGITSFSSMSSSSSSAAPSQPNSQSQNNTSHTTVSRHSMFMQKLGLGAPRRLTGQTLTQSTSTQTNITANRTSNTTKSNTTNTVMSTKKESTTPSRTSHIAIAAALSATQEKENISERKHSLQLTPKKYSPLHKRTNIMVAPSPEQGRRAIVPQIKSQLKMPNVTKDIFNEPNYLDLNHVQSIIDKKKEIAQLKKEIAQYKQQLAQNTESKEKDARNDVEKNLQVNERSYQLLEQIGKGGSSKVFRASTKESPNRFLAVKIVNLNDHESTTIDELKGEIKILHKLRHSPRVVKLLDYSITKQHLYFVMECGDLDLATVLTTRHTFDEYYDLEFIRYHAKEMIECLKAIHQLEIVHLDLKPANFVFVSGVLKLIDFGISNTIQSHTVNIYREFQMGTPNYMAPETLIDGGNDPDLPSIWKVSKPADIWSFGCILYQLTYGITPYASYTGTKKILAITNPKVSINYPATAINLRKKNDSSNIKVCLYLQDMTRRCLIRDPTHRVTVAELLKHPFINPVVVDYNVINEVVRGCVGFGGRHTELKEVALGKISDVGKEARLDRLVDGVWKRVSND